MIKILIVEDSPIMQELLEHIFNSDEELHVIGKTGNGAEALEFLSRHKPDVITMDVHMPKMNGFQATRKIMETCPVPIVIVTASYMPEDVNLTFRALEAGAVAVEEKPMGPGNQGYEDVAVKLVQTVKLMSEVKVVKRQAQYRKADITSITQKVKLNHSPQKIRCVAVGASTGGPPAIQTILSKLPRNFPAPVLIVQHITPGFIGGMVNWLGETTGFPVHIASQGENALPGHIYFAPDDQHMGIESSGRLKLSRETPEYGMRPSVSYLLRSVEKAYGPQGAGVLLTGMGSDGAKELKMLRDRGAVTLVQDKNSSVVHGMPGEALMLGAAMYILPPEEIASTLSILAMHHQL